jgi:hypothetical protein
MAKDNEPQIPQPQPPIGSGGGGAPEPAPEPIKIPPDWGTFAETDISGTIEIPFEIKIGTGNE